MGANSIHRQDLSHFSLIGFVIYYAKSKLLCNTSWAYSNVPGATLVKATFMITLMCK
jgi:hypothetical protein